MLFSLSGATHTTCYMPSEEKTLIIISGYYDHETYRLDWKFCHVDGVFSVKKQADSQTSVVSGL